MDFHALTRKELQTLCKNNGIPANRSNAFMADALAKTRTPLSQMDANRGHKVNPSTGRSLTNDDRLSGSALKAPLMKTSGTKSDEFGATKKPPVYRNNFLRKGKRKDVSASQSSETHHEYAKVYSKNISNLGQDVIKLTTNAAQRPDAGAAQVKKFGAEIIAAPAFPPSTSSARARVDNDLNIEIHSVNAAKEATVTAESIGAPSSHNLTNAAKERIVDKVRSQIEASLCSKMMHPPARRPPAPSLTRSSERILFESNVEPGSRELLKLPIVNLEQEKENCPSPRLSPCKVRLREEECLTSAPRQRDSSSELIDSPALLSFSPLVQRVEEKVRSIVERVNSFWEASDLTVVNSVSSPV